MKIRFLTDFIVPAEAICSLLLSRTDMTRLLAQGAGVADIHFGRLASKPLLNTKLVLVW